jgi:glycosyltransferase involved in cell wall biosynthesis
VIVISHGLSINPSSEKPNAETKKLAEQPYLLYVGGIDIRKNVVGLLETFYQLKPDHPNLRLITVGKEFSLKQLEDLGWHKVLEGNKDYAKDVIAPGFLSAGDLLYLYQKASAFVFPSRYEGFGLPVLEAMSAGCPVVAYNNSSIPEVAGSAALLVKDGDSLVPAVQRVLNDPKLRAELIRKGKERVKLFPWDKTAKKTLAVLRKTAA